MSAEPTKQSKDLGTEVLEARNQALREAAAIVDAIWNHEGSRDICKVCRARDSISKLIRAAKQMAQVTPPSLEMLPVKPKEVL